MELTDPHPRSARTGVVNRKDVVVEVRATGRTPEAVTNEIQKIMDEQTAGGFRLTTVQPIIYNSSTTGYLLLFFHRDAG